MNLDERAGRDRTDCTVEELYTIQASLAEKVVTDVVANSPNTVLLTRGGPVIGHCETKAQTPSTPSVHKPDPIISAF